MTFDIWSEVKMYRAKYFLNNYYRMQCCSKLQLSLVTNVKNNVAKFKVSYSINHRDSDFHCLLQVYVMLSIARQEKMYTQIVYK